MKMCHNKTLLDGSYLMVSVLKFGIDTTENAWYRIGSYPLKKAGIIIIIIINNIFYEGATITQKCFSCRRSDEI